jgi:hypothetical protein
MFSCPSREKEKESSCLSFPDISTFSLVDGYKFSIPSPTIVLHLSSFKPHERTLPRFIKLPIKPFFVLCFRLIPSPSIRTLLNMYFSSTQTPTTPDTYEIHNMAPSQHPRLPRPSPCKAKNLLLRSIRPIPNSPSQTLLRKSDLCPSKCIYCDIWKLALLVSSRQNTPSSTNNSPTSPSFPPSQTQQHHQQRGSSQTCPRTPSSPRPTTPQHQAFKSLESAYTLQRARLSSIISICTVEGAEECTGLRVAHDRCLAAVLELVRKERTLLRQQEETEIARQMERERADREVRAWRERERERDRECGYGYGYGYGYGDSYATRASANTVSCAM